MKTPRVYYSILAVFCTAVLCIGLAGAADQTATPRHSAFATGQGHQGFDLTNVTLQQDLVARYQQQGIDVTGLQAAFQSGNMTDVKEWMKTHRPVRAANATAGQGHQKFDLTNTTLQQELVARYQQQGTDVTGLQAAFQSGNMTDVKEWMKAHRPAVPAAKTGTGVARKGFDLTNTTLQQDLVARYQQQGIDVTGLQAAFQSGNMTDVKEWMKTHHPAFNSTAASGTTPPFTHTTTGTKAHLAQNQTTGGHGQPGHVQWQKHSS